MSEKLIAGLVTAIVITPVCAVCILGPAVLASIFAGIAGWLGDFDPVAMMGLILVAGTAVYGIIRRRRARQSPMIPRGKVSHER